MGPRADNVTIFCGHNCEFQVREVSGGVMVQANGRSGVLVYLRRKGSERVAIGQFENERALCDWLGIETNRGEWIIESRLNSGA